MGSYKKDAGRPQKGLVGVSPSKCISSLDSSKLFMEVCKTWRIKEIIGVSPTLSTIIIMYGLMTSILS